MESSCLVEHGLALRGIHNQHRVVGLHRFLYFLHLFEKSVFLLVSPRSVDDDHLLNTRSIRDNTTAVTRETCFCFCQLLLSKTSIMTHVFIEV